MIFARHLVLIPFMGLALVALTGCWAEIGGGSASSLLRPDASGAAIDFHTGLASGENNGFLGGGLFGGTFKLRFADGYQEAAIGPSGFLGVGRGVVGLRLHAGANMAPVAFHRDRAAFSPLGTFAELNAIVCSNYCFSDGRDHGLLSVGVGIDHRFVFHFRGLDPHQEAFFFFRIGIGSFGSL